MKRFISFITTLSRIKRPQLVLGGLWIFAVIFTVCAAPPAFAITLSPAAAAAGILMNLFLSLGNLIQWASVLFLSLIVNIILPGQNSLIFGDELRTAWSVMLDIANVVFFLALFVFAILIITRQAGYNFKKAVTALITAIALANLSLIIVQVLIEMGDALRNFSSLIPAFGMQGGDTQQLKEWLQGLVLPKDFNIRAEPGDIWAKVWISFEVMAAQAVIAYVLFRLMFVLIERAIRLAILAIFGPIQAALSILPQKELQGLGGNWFSDVLRWVLVLPLSFILIGIARLIMPTNSAETLQNFLNQAQTPDALTDTAKLLYLIVGLGILIAASTVPALLKVPVTALTSMIPNAANKLGQSAWKAAKGGMSNFGKDMAFKASQKTAAGRWIYSQTAGRYAARQAQVEGQKKQRADAAEKAGQTHTIKRYMSNQQSINIILNQKAAKAGFKDFAAWKETDPTKASAAKKALDRTKLGINASASEKEFTGIVAKAIRDEYDKNKTAEETFGDYKKARDKAVASNGRDTEAVMDAFKFAGSLKQMGMHLRGEEGDLAAKYRNQIVENDGDKLKEWGIPNKIGIAKVAREKLDGSGQQGATEATGEDYVQQAVGQRRIGELQKDMPSARFDATIKSTSEQTLKTLSENESVVSGLASTIESALNQAETHKGAIEKILGRTDLSVEQKETAIDSEFEGASGMKGIAKALANGVSIEDLRNGRELAKGIGEKTITTQQIKNVVELNTLQPKVDEINSKINNIPLKDTYKEIAKNIASSKYEDFGADYINEMEGVLTSAFADHQNPEASIYESGVDIDRFARFNDTTGISTMNPGKEYNTPGGAGRMTIKEAMDIFNQLDKGLKT